MIYHGVQDEGTPLAFIVEDFLNRKMLAKLGYQFGPENLSDFQVQAFNVISSKFAKLESDEIKRRK
jgi:hypothetical protein